MYQTDKIQACLGGLLGFREETLPADLKASETGEYFNDYHPLITLENIRYAAPEFAAPEGLESWIRQTVNAAAVRVVSEVVTRKKLQGVGKSLVNDLFLFDGGGNLANLEIKEGRFVGWEITVTNSKDLVTNLQQIGTQFTQENPELTVYLYHSAQPEPLAQITVNHNSRGGIVWTELTGINLDTLTPGTYYLGYYEADVTGQAVKRTDNLAAAPCVTCNAYNTRSYKLWSKRLQIRAFSVAPGYLNETRDLWDPARVTYYSGGNFGLNLQVSIECDITAFICRYRRLLTKALGLQVAVDILNKIAFSQRQNGPAQDLKNEAFVELNNRANFQPGLISQLDKALKALEFDLSDFNSECLKSASSGVDWGAF